MFGDNPDFYPTPRPIAEKMLAKISEHAVNFLEPSAGKGDLAREILRNGVPRRNERFKHEEEYERDEFDKDDWQYNGRRNHSGRKVDVIESHPDLVSALAGKGFPIVGHDWLTYDGVSYYDAVVVNPPFGNGDEHLLKAWEFLHAGEIVCLLNEETVKNPCTKRRQRLAQIIEEAGGEVEYLGECFRTAERPTDVRVAMVYLKKSPPPDDTTTAWATVTQERQPDTEIESEADLPAIRDELGNMQHYWDSANTHMSKAFAHLRVAAQFMAANGIEPKDYGDDNYGNIIKMALTNATSARAEFIRMHRRDGWKRVLQKMQFHKWLDSRQRDEFLRDVERNCNIPFTKENIWGTLDNIFANRKKLFEQSCANVFDALTRHYHGNTVSEGWKTNDNFKVNNRIVFPYGCRYDSFLGFRTNMDRGETALVDLDRCLAVLDGYPFESIQTAYESLDNRFRNDRRVYPGGGYTESSYWEIRYFKKGTIHMKIKNPKVLERFNAACAAGKLWLGMNTNERDEFPGRKVRYYNDETHKHEERDLDPPMPADPMALINQFRREYGAGEAEPITAAPATTPAMIPAAAEEEPSVDDLIAANTRRIEELQRALASTAQ